METDWKKKYEEALGIASRIKDDNTVSTPQEVAEQIFPELAESEDEKIRKIITLALIASEDELSDFYSVHNITRKECTDWLEKQKESGIRWYKSDNRNNPKKPYIDKAGMFYTTDGRMCYASEIEKQKEQTEELSTRLNGLMQEYVKSGKDEEEQDHRLKCYQLFWDALGDSEFFEQKEQKPAESISQLTIQGKGVYKICPRCKERMVRDDSKVYTSMPPQYGYECPKCGEIEFDTVMYDNPEMEERKAAEWSEEDERMYNSALWHIKNSSGNGGKTSGEYEVYHWVKSLKERLKSLRPQSHKWYIKKGHWYMCIVDKSEYGWTKGKVYQSPEDNRIETNHKGSLTNWPNSEPWFRPATRDEIPDNQPHWKPSEEQMRQLGYVAEQNKHNMLGKELMTLYNDLKKLL